MQVVCSLIWEVLGSLIWEVLGSLIWEVLGGRRADRGRTRTPAPPAAPPTAAAFRFVVASFLQSLFSSNNSS